jgi:hypothetical protein
MTRALFKDPAAEFVCAIRIGAGLQHPKRGEERESMMCISEFVKDLGRSWLVTHSVEPR